MEIKKPQLDQLDRIAMIAIVTSIIAIAVAAGIAGKLQNQIEHMNRSDTSLRNDVKLWQTYVIDLRTEMQLAGLAVPPPPQELDHERRQ